MQWGLQCVVQSALWCWGLRYGMESAVRCGVCIVVSDLQSAVGSEMCYRVPLKLQRRMMTREHPA